MSELGLAEMLFMHILVGISIFIIANVVLVVVGSIFLFVGTIIAFRIKDFFYPTPRLPEDVRDRVLREAADFVRSKHRPWDSDDLFAEYLWVGPERVNLAWEKMYGKKRF